MLDVKHRASYSGGMRKLPLKTRAKLLRLLCEGQSMRAAARLEGVAFNSVAKLLAEAGAACADLHDEWVVDVPSVRVQCDEIWAFVHAKAKNVPTAKAAPEGAGDCWTWTALDPDTKLMISYAVGDRSAELARLFMFDLADRLANRVQLTTDGFGAYLKAVTDAFSGDVDYARLIKLFGEPKGVTSPERKYSPGECTGIIKEPVFGKPDMAKVSTSHVERQNLNMRMGMRRFTRLTNGFSKKVESHAAMVALYTTFYNFCRVHKTLRVTPAMQAGLTDHIWDMEEVVAHMDFLAPKPNRPATYKKQISE
jgi:IS1 family transposase